MLKCGKKNLFQSVIHNHRKLTFFSLSFRVSFMIPNLFTGYDIGYMHIETSLKCQFDKWFA